VNWLQTLGALVFQLGLVGLYAAGWLIILRRSAQQAGSSLAVRAWPYRTPRQLRLYFLLTLIAWLVAQAWLFFSFSGLWQSLPSQFTAACGTLFILSAGGAFWYRCYSRLPGRPEPARELKDAAPTGWPALAS
jgi:hypothetical protein